MEDRSTASEFPPLPHVLLTFFLRIALLALAYLFCEGFFGGMNTGPGYRGPCARARTTMGNLIATIHTYEHKTGGLPVPGSGAKGFDYDTDTSAPAGVMSLLKKVVYLSGLSEAKMANGLPTDGYTAGNSGIALCDPWGHHYQIRMDGDGDGWVADPEISGARLKSAAIVWSAGEDGDPDTWDDNESSWGH